MRVFKNESGSLPRVVVRAMRQVGGCLSCCLSLVCLVALSPAAAALPEAARSVSTNATATEQTVSSESVDIAQSDESATSTFIRPRYSINHSEGGGYTGVTGVGAFYPLFQTAGENLIFLVGDLNVSNDGDFGGGLQSGYRALLGDDMIWGVYSGLDVRDTGNSTFTQAGVGAELIGGKWDAHFNINVPLGDTRRSETVGSQLSSRFQGNLLLLNQDSTERVESALSTVSLDGSMQLFDWGGDNALWGQGGLYYLGGADGSDSLGARLSLDQRLQDNVRLGLGIQHDGVFDTNVVLSANVLFGGPTQRSTNLEDGAQGQLWARAAEPLVRTRTVLVEEKITTTTERDIPAINPATGRAYTFRHVDPLTGMPTGSGTVEAPTDTLINAVGITLADADNIIYAQAGDIGDGMTIPNGVQVLSTGPSQLLSTQLGRLTLPGSGSGIRPTVRSTISVGSNSRVSGLNINAGGNDGIVANGMNIAIEDNTITNADIGIDLPDVSGTISIARNQISDTSDDGIYFDDLDEPGNTTVTVADNQITNTGETGIYFDGIVGDATADVTISNNTISQTGDEGIYFDYIYDNATANITIINNTISQTDDEGIDFYEISDNATANITISGNNISRTEDEGIEFGDIYDDAIANITISGNTISNTDDEGIYFEGILDNAIANITISGNTISNIDNSGIYFYEIYDDATANITISDNVISDVGDSGIYFEEISDSATATIMISGNTISAADDSGIYFYEIYDDVIANITISDNVISDVDDSGIYFEYIYDNATANITISGNTISAADDSGIYFYEIYDSAIASLVITDNTITNPGSDGVFIDHSSAADLCLSLSNNIVTAPIGDGFYFESSGAGEFQLVDRLNITTANIGSFDPADITTNGAFVSGTVGTAPCR